MVEAEPGDDPGMVRAGAAAAARRRELNVSQRSLAADGVINAGALGRPANDGRTNVWYTIVDVGERTFDVEFVPVVYDFETLAREMRLERLPDAFIETIVSGWWTTCLEVLPAKERSRGRY